MDVFNAKCVPCLAHILGDEATLPSLRRSFDAFPRGVTYWRFRHILLTHLHSSSLSPGHNSLSDAAKASLTASPPIAPTEAPHLLTFASQDEVIAASAAAASATNSATASVTAPVTTALSTSHAPLPIYEDHDANRERKPVCADCARGSSWQDSRVSPLTPSAAPQTHRRGQRAARYVGTFAEICLG